MKQFAISVGAGLACLALSFVCASAQGYGNVPAGSYTQSCQNIRVHGDRLIAQCQANNGQYVRSSLQLDQCGNGDIANYDGQLVCARRGGYGEGSGSGYTSANGQSQSWWGSGTPSGSYQGSCTHVHMRGSTLVADCTNDQSVYVRSYLDLTQCRRTDHIANVNGQLRCWYNPH